MLKFLIDECLSPKLAGLARELGYDATHVNWVNLHRTRDDLIAVYAVMMDYVLVTNNGSDYKPIYRSLDVHPGLVIILPSIRRVDQLALFEAVVGRLEGEPDVVNKLIEVDMHTNITITDFPPFQSNI
jgi:predicted nuclease of predicted toxin-antitoxin system